MEQAVWRRDLVIGRREKWNADDVLKASTNNKVIVYIHSRIFIHPRRPRKEAADLGVLNRPGPALFDFRGESSRRQLGRLVPGYGWRMRLQLAMDAISVDTYHKLLPPRMHKSN